MEYKIPPPWSFVGQYLAFAPPDFEQQPWSELGRVWPHPEAYLNKLRLFKTGENAGDRRVLVTVHLIDEGVSP